MFQLNSQLIIGWLIMASIMFFSALIFNGFKYLRSFFWRGLGGISLILVANFVLQPYNIYLGINLFTTAVGGLLGAPGVAMLYCLSYLLI